MSNFAKNSADLKIPNAWSYSSNKLNSERCNYNNRKGEKVIPYKENANISLSPFEEWGKSVNKDVWSKVNTILIPIKEDKSILLYLDGIKVCQLDSKFRELSNAINKSKYITELEENWDDEGSQKYEKDTWVRAIKFICDYATFINKYNGNIIPTPNIYHGPLGSIDMEWQKDNFYLLINIDKQVQEVSFYSKTAMHEFEGKFKLKNYNPELIPLFCIFNIYFSNV